MEYELQEIQPSVDLLLLPSDTILEILRNLFPEDLRQYQLVSTGWRNMI